MPWAKEVVSDFCPKKINEKIIPAMGSPIEAAVGLTISVHKGIVLQLNKTEFDRLMALGLTCVEEVKGDTFTFPYRLRLTGNVLSAKMRK